MADKMNELREYYDNTDRHIATGGTLLLALLMAGVKGKTTPLASK